MPRFMRARVVMGRRVVRMVRVEVVNFILDDCAWLLDMG